MYAIQSRAALDLKSISSVVTKLRRGDTTTEYATLVHRSAVKAVTAVDNAMPCPFFLPIRRRIFFFKDKNAMPCHGTG